MRFAFVVQGDPPGGVETVTLALTPHLRRAGHDVVFALTEPGEVLIDRLQRDDLPWEPARTPEECREVLQRTAPDVVHAFTRATILTALPAAAEAVPSALRVAGVVGALGRDDNGDLAAAMGLADGAVAVSEWVVQAEAVRLGLPRERVLVIGNGVDIPARQADPSTQPPTAVVVANFFPYKGHDLLLDALAQVRSPLRVRLCGDGPLRDHVLGRLGSAPAHVRVEHVPVPADVPAELVAAQLAIAPSLTEGFGQAIVEAMAAGLPVVTTSFGGPAGLVEHGRSAFTVTPEAGYLALGIDLLAQRPDVRVRLGAEARRRVASLRWSDAADAHVRAYEELARLRRQRCTDA